MFVHVLDKDQNFALREIASRIEPGDFYLAGGTGLSLQLGHRKSEGLDFFVPHRFDPPSLCEQLRCICPEDTRVISAKEKYSCEVSMLGIPVRFFECRDKVLCDYVCSPDLPGLKVAGIPDIAAMKGRSIGMQGSKKDFFDLYEIFQLTDYDVHDLVNDLHARYGNRINFAYIGMALNFFQKAQQEEFSETLIPYDWDEIKRFFSGIQPEFFRELKSLFYSSPAGICM